MNAKQIIERYNAGERNFQRLNLRGMSFKGANLSGANFSECDIHSTNFRNAILKNTNFTNAKGGLQKHWYFSLLIMSILLSALAGTFNYYFAYLIFNIISPSSFSGYPINNVIFGITGLVIYSSLIVVTWRKSFVLGAIIATGTAIVAGTIADIFTEMGTTTVAGAIIAGAVGTVGLTVMGGIAGAVSAAGGVTGVEAVIIVGISIVAGAIAGIASVSESVPKAVVGIGSIPVAFFWNWIGWRASQGDSRDAWVRSFAVAYGAIGGTCFRGADLTDVNFTGARLKSTDFREAKLVRTIFTDTIKLDQVRPGKSYLGIKKIRELLLNDKANPDEIYSNLVNLKGLNLAGKNLVSADFSGSNLSDSNLSGANLTDANLITTNLNDADLKNANLTRTKLVQTQLDNADLTRATLTGACIEDWGITIYTILKKIHCDYVFMRFIDGDKRRRKPDGEDMNFAEGEFVEFIKPLVDTLDLYHRQVKDPRTVALALRKLQNKNPDANIDPISWEQRGKNSEDILVRAKISEKANPSQLHSAHFQEYNKLQQLPTSEIAALMAEVKSQKETINMLKGFVGDALARPINIQQDNTMNQKDGSKYDMSGSTFGMGVNEGIISGNVTITGKYNAAPNPELEELGKEIGDRLTRLEKQYGNQTPQEQLAITTEFINELDAEPDFAKRVLSAIAIGGVEALKSYLIGPAASFLLGAVDSWQKTAQPSQKKLK